MRSEDLGGNTTKAPALVSCALSCKIRSVLVNASAPQILVFHHKQIVREQEKLNKLSEIKVEQGGKKI
jgi:hypothetical protein